MNKVEILKKVIKNEGGFQKDYSDRGNWTSGEVGKGLLKGTKYGITAMNFPDLEIEKLTIHEAMDLYISSKKLKLWNELYTYVKCDNTLYLLMDMSVNMGVQSSVKVLQTMLIDFGCDIVKDGIFGRKTLSAMNGISHLTFEVLKVYFARRYAKIVINSWKENKKFVNKETRLKLGHINYLKGWFNRLDKLKI